MFLCSFYYVFADCSRAGSFYSITNHFRGRRSTRSIPEEEFTSAADRPRDFVDMTSQQEVLTSRKRRSVEDDWLRGVERENDEYFPSNNNNIDEVRLGRQNEVKLTYMKSLFSKRASDFSSNFFDKTKIDIV